MKKILFTLIFSLMYLSAWCSDQCVFFISRNLNGNVINYDIRLKNGKLDTKEPLHVYWNNIANNPPGTKELSFIQRSMAYGYSVVKAGTDEVYVKLKAYNKRQIHICKRGGKWVGIVTIDGKTCYLTEIYAHCPSRTSCDYIELRGITVDGGTPVKETVK